jgi:hypothetical protein
MELYKVKNRNAKVKNKNDKSKKYKLDQELWENLKAYKKLAEELKLTKVKSYSEMLVWLRKTY